jgi:hypothetical protein
MSETDEMLRVKLNAESGKLRWCELERHFARGVVIRVTPGLDLIDVALCMTKDDRDSVAAWMGSGRLGRVSPDEARGWHENDCLLWAVVVSPWVLVQEPARH